jgi:3-methyl-2-oxobutanoate hydroxymethyltransferase
MKGKGKIVSLTAYSTPLAKLMDPHVDLIIVGDSVGMVMYGLDSTLSVTLDMMIRHGAAVTRGASKACVVVDMPFGTYQESPQQAFRNAVRVVTESQAQGVKLEGGSEMLETVEFLVQRGVPVMPHIGLMPQHANVVGGFKAQARSEKEITALVELAVEFERRGAFSLLVEATSEEAARRVTEAVGIPVIGIGASPYCDGQVLVTEDVLGLFSDYTPKFVKRYAELGGHIHDALSRFEQDVRSGAFPTAEHCFSTTQAEK